MLLAMAITAIGGFSLLVAYAVFSQRYYRAHGAKAGDQSETHSAASWLTAGVAKGSTLWKRQADTELERARKRAIRPFFIFIVWLLVLPAAAVVMNLLPGLQTLALPTVSVPALPAIAATEAGSAERWMALLSLGGLSVLYLWSLNMALRGGPDWRSGKPGDPFRFPRDWVIAGCLVGLAIVPAVFWVIWTASGT